MRMHFGGHCSVAFLRPGQLHKHLLATKGSYAKVETPSILEMVAFLRTIENHEQFDALRKVCQVWGGVIRENCVLLAPPGVLVAIRPLNGKRVWGLRRSFMLKH